MIEYSYLIIGVIFIIYGIFIIFTRKTLFSRFFEQVFFTLFMVLILCQNNRKLSYIEIFGIVIIFSLVVLGYLLNHGKFSIYNRSLDETIYNIEEILTENAIDFVNGNYGYTYKMIVEKNKEIEIKRLLGIVTLDLKSIKKSPLYDKLLQEIKKKSLKSNIIKVSFGSLLYIISGLALLALSGIINNGL